MIIKILENKNSLILKTDEKKRIRISWPALKIWPHKIQIKHISQCP
jgi:hypothetical protein